MFDRFGLDQLELIGEPVCDLFATREVSDQLCRIPSVHCELLDLIGTLHGERPHIRMKDWRPGDQRYYVSDTRKFKAATGWAPKVSVREGVERLYEWLIASRGLAIPPRAVEGGFHAVLTH